MFQDEKTSEIIQFLNSLLASEKTDDFMNLYMEALIELRDRVPIMASLYKYYNYIEDHGIENE